MVKSIRIAGIVLTCIMLSIHAQAQQKILTRAVVSSTINFISPEDEDPSNAPGGMMQSMMNGETKVTTWIKNDMVKTLVNADFGRTTVIRNNNAKTTTTLLEIMGTKQGFVSTDEEMASMKKKADSARNSKNGRENQRSEPRVDIIETGQTKKIAGYNCKKAFLVMTKKMDVTDTLTVWYNPDLKLKQGSAIAGMGMFGGQGLLPGLEKLNGYLMRCEVKMAGNRRMEMEVTRIDTTKEVSDKEFDIPKDIELKPMKEMHGMFGGHGGQ